MTYRFLLDEVTLDYDATRRLYLARFHKIVHNEGPDPLRHVYARIVVNVFPDHPHLARPYYRNHPLDLAQIDFAARDSTGHDLLVEVQHAHDANIELLLSACDGRGRPKPILPGRAFEYNYGFRIGDAQWGPYLDRHVRFPTDRLVARLRFDRGAARVQCQRRNSGDDWQETDNLLQRTAFQGREENELVVCNPELHSRFRLRWQFEDGREQQLFESFQMSVQRGVSHSPDFRTLQWFNQDYRFSATQARCVEVLFRAWELGNPDIGQRAILAEAESDARRLRDLFRGTRGAGHDAWGTLIVPGKTRGTFRLATPEASRRKGEHQ